MDPVSVLVVDDSALMRNLVSRIVSATPGLQVADKAMNGAFALQKIPLCRPDIIVLDIEMPVMNGIEFLKERKKQGIDIPVIILSSIAKEGAHVTMECLELGASDFVTKPSGSESEDIGKVASILTHMLLSYGRQYQNRHMKRSPSVYGEKQQEPETAAVKSVLPAVPAQKKPSVITPLRQPGRIAIIAIGISTGGPNALREVFRHLDPSLSQPIVVVQHMPAGFTDEFAQSLNHICPLEVKEAKEGDLVKNGRILIAPGDRHMLVEQRSLAIVARLSDEPPRNGHRPSADVLFESIAKTFQNRALGIIMTGMGRDGAAQLAEMRRQGAHTIGQDEQSSVVYGMPKVAFEMGGVQRQVSLENMAQTINSLAREYR